MRKRRNMPGIRCRHAGEWIVYKRLGAPLADGSPRPWRGTAPIQPPAAGRSATSCSRRATAGVTADRRGGVHGARAKRVDHSSSRVSLAAGPARALQRLDVHERVHVHECPNRSRRRCGRYALRPPVLQGLGSRGLRGCLGRREGDLFGTFPPPIRRRGFPRPVPEPSACGAGCSCCGGRHSRGRNAPLSRRAASTCRRRRRRGRGSCRRQSRGS